MIDIHKEYESNNSGKFKIINYVSQSNILIEFLITGYRTTVSSARIRNGVVKDKLKPRVCGVGFVGVGRHKPSIKCKETQAYRIWKGMIARCYSHKGRDKDKCYRNCTVSDEWCNFQNFARWFYENYIDGYHMDKDTLQRGVKNKVYSESTCIFLSPKDNLAEAHSLTKKIERAIKTLQCIADNPEWDDHHCRAQKCIDDIS